MVTGSTREITIAWRDIRLAGTLHLPAAPPPCPAVLMLQGGGAADRDFGGYFPPIRDAFLARGIATFSFDKPGVGGSTGDWRHYALEGGAEQAVAALDRLRAAEGIDGRRVGVWGHSQGGWLVQMLAARDPDLSFAVANSGSAIGIERQDHYGWEQTLRADGAADQDVAAALAFLRAVQEAAHRGDDFATVEERLVRAARGQSWYGYLEIEDAVDWGHERRFIQEAYEPLEALARVRCPFLAVFGALDVLMPVWESAQLCSQALRDAGNLDATVVVFPQGNHRILIAETRQFVPGYLDLLGDWALYRVARHEHPVI
jgi:pimeloyl-ACP methyl ester carboxylesterase